MSACSPVTPAASLATSTIAHTTTVTVTPILTQTSTSTPTISVTPTAILKPTHTPSSSPTMAPLATFSSSLLRQGVQPHAYLEDHCDYLAKRWSPDASLPGTVVVPIMFHSIAQNGTRLSDPNKDITADQFMAFVAYARYLGFETITTRELLDFLQENAKIPPRSMLLIVDDRRPGMIREQMLPVLEESDWTVTAAYIADPTSLIWAWDLMEQLFATGRVDVQSHGYTGQLYIVKDTPADQIQNEIWNSTPVLEEHFGETPLAFIWPGGNFTPESVQIAREGGYSLGFSAYSRGPLLFNWIPLGETESTVNDPLMVLPRAWSSSANFNLDEAVKISDQAASYAQHNFSVEAEWFRIYCGGELANPWE